MLVLYGLKHWGFLWSRKREELLVWNSVTPWMVLYLYQDHDHQKVSNDSYKKKKQIIYAIF